MAMSGKDKKKLQDKLEGAARRAFDLEKGKTILVVFKKTGEGFRVDYRCLDKDTDVCNGCGLRFKCYSSQHLTIYSDELSLPIDVTINEAVTNYVERHKPRKETDGKS